MGLSARSSAALLHCLDQRTTLHLCSALSAHHLAMAKARRSAARRFSTAFLTHKAAAPGVLARLGSLLCCQRRFRRLRCRFHGSAHRVHLLLPPMPHNFHNGMYAAPQQGRALRVRPYASNASSCPVHAADLRMHIWPWLLTFRLCHTVFCPMTSQNRLLHGATARTWHFR